MTLSDFRYFRDNAGRQAAVEALIFGEGDFVVVPCEACGTEGRIYHGTAHDGDCAYVDPCAACEGTGGEIVPATTPTLADIERKQCHDCGAHCESNLLADHDFCEDCGNRRYWELER